MLRSTLPWVHGAVEGGSTTSIAQYNTAVLAQARTPCKLLRMLSYFCEAIIGYLDMVSGHVSLRCLDSTQRA
jgi:hypothetical protein